MKLKHLLLTGLLGFAFTLAGCGNNDDPNPPTPDPDPVIPTIDWDEKDYICKGGSYGGYFSDVNVERMLCVDTSYEFMFESSHATDKSFTIVSTNPNIANWVKREDNPKMFNLDCKAQGDIILTIENADGILVYRNIIRVRNAIATDKMNDYLRSVDRFETPREYVAYLGDYKMSFDYLEEFDNKFAGILKGGDDYDSNVNIIFTLEYEEDLPERDCYLYKLTTLYTETSLTYIGYLDIARAGDWLYMYEDETLGTGGLLAMFVPRVLK
ncbi:MAG: hypothetical protein MJ222_05095 [Bacilli bacterium]|nr:hypothetical protein [Bacilli bacterium]